MMTDIARHAVSAYSASRIVVVSFGYLHDDAPSADITLDTRHHLRNPHSDPAMRERTGQHAAVREHVRATPGVQRLVEHAAVMARDLLADVADRQDRLVTVAVGCAGGRHRSVVIAEDITTVLHDAGLDAETDHRDIARPVLQQ